MEYFIFHYLLATSANPIKWNNSMTRRSCQPCSRLWARAIQAFPNLCSTCRWTLSLLPNPLNELSTTICNIISICSSCLLLAKCLSEIYQLLSFMPSIIVQVKFDNSLYFLLPLLSCSTSLPLASTRWVSSTFSSPRSLSSKKRH